MSFEPITRWVLRCDGDTTRGRCTERLCWSDTDDPDDPLTVWVPSVFDVPALLDPVEVREIESVGWVVHGDGSRALCPRHVAALDTLARAAIDGLPFPDPTPDPTPQGRTTGRHRREETRDDQTRPQLDRTDQRTDQPDPSDGGVSVSAGTRAAVITAVTTVHRLDPDPTDPDRCWTAPVRARWSWDPRVPWVIELALSAGQQSVTWQIGVELVWEGIAGPAGIGDVTFLPDLHSPVHRHLHLSSPDGRASFRLDTAALAQFLGSIFAAADPVALAAEQIAALDPDDFTPGGRFDPTTRGDSTERGDGAR